MYFPFIADGNGENIKVIPEEEYLKIYIDRQFDDEHVEALRNRYESLGFKFILPIRDDGYKGRWRWGYSHCAEACEEGFF